jgi:hypothetical protein
MRWRPVRKRMKPKAKPKPAAERKNQHPDFDKPWHELTAAEKKERRLRWKVIYPQARARRKAAEAFLSIDAAAAIAADERPALSRATAPVPAWLKGRNAL